MQQILIFRKWYFVLKPKKKEIKAGFMGGKDFKRNKLGERKSSSGNKTKTRVCVIMYFAEDPSVIKNPFIR